MSALYTLCPLRHLRLDMLQSLLCRQKKVPRHRFARFGLIDFLDVDIPGLVDMPPRSLEIALCAFNFIQFHVVSIGFFSTACLDCLLEFKLGDEKRARDGHLSLGQRDGSSSDEEMEEPNSFDKSLGLELSNEMGDDWASDVFEVALSDT